MKKLAVPQLADSRVEPSARQLDAVTRAAAKAATARHTMAMTAFYAAIQRQAAAAKASLAHPPSVPALAPMSAPMPLPKPRARAGA
jgi:hypothetical protein